MDERTTPVQADPLQAPQRVGLLVGRSPQIRGRLFELGEAAVIGRDPGLAIVLAFEGVSRRHAEVVAAGELAFVLRDLGSTNGTLVNGTTIGEHRLAHGDRIQLGPLELEFRLVTAGERARVEQSAAAIARLAILSERELEVARLVGQGMRSEDIARRLFIATRTVNTHLEHIYQRLEIKSRATLAALIAQADAEP